MRPRLLRPDERKRPARPPLAVLFALAALGPAACRPMSESARVLETVDRLAGLAEKKDVEGAMAMIADGYRDFEGRDKSGLRGLLEGYLAGRAGIVIHRLGGTVDFPEAGRAGLEADVALSSGPAEALRRLVRISPDLYRIRLELGLAGDRWLVGYAEWRTIGLSEALPGSLGLLKGFFPNLKTE